MPADEMLMKKVGRGGKMFYLHRSMKSSSISCWIAILAGATLLSVLALRIYSAHEDAVSASYGRSVPSLGEKLALTGIPNAGKVSDTLYRGAQSRGDGYRELRRLGVPIVVDLRSTASEQAAEQHAVESLGMQHVGIPTNAFSAPSDNQVATFLKVLRDNPGRKIFVHCYFGDDRTGPRWRRTAWPNSTGQQTRLTTRCAPFISIVT
jgi:protein tyrosine phosphatase (PTP) superfamily phosphohydrolase (DUF442 family)